MDILPTLTPLYGSLLLLVILAAGLLMIFAPSQARPLFKNAALSLSLFLIASILLQAFCSGYRDSLP